MSFDISSIFFPVIACFFKDDKKLIVINGQEITKNMPPGHINAVFINEANNLFNLVLDSGINFIDTSICYGDSEKLIGKYISHRRSEFFLASKCGCPVDGEGGHVFTKEIITLK